MNTAKRKKQKSVGRSAKLGALLRQMGDTKNKETWTLRPDSELQKAIEEAMAATGTPRQRLIFECIRKELPAVVRKIAQERLEAQKSFERNSGEKGKP